MPIPHDHDQFLSYYTDDIVTNLDIRNAFLSRLEVNGLLTKKQRLSLHDTVYTRGSIQAAEELLDVIRQGNLGEDTLPMFIQSLKQHEQFGLVEFLENKLGEGVYRRIVVTTDQDPPSISTDLDKTVIIIESIKQHCKGLQYFPLVEWQKLYEKRELNQLFTQLTLIEQDPKGGEVKRTALSHYKEIFAKSPNKICLFGNTGTGKTTLMRKLAFEVSVKGSFSPFKTAIPIPLRKVTKDVNLAMFIANEIIPEEHNIGVDHVRKFLNTHKDTLLVLLDGLDEYSGASSQINSILSGRSFPESTVVVTTRPTRMPPIEYPCDRYIEVSGFSEKQQEHYMTLFFGIDHTKGEKLVKEIENKCLQELSTYPLLLMFICVLYDWTANIGDSTVDLYRRIIKFLYDNYCKKMSTDPSASEFNSLMQEMGKMAWHKMCHHELEFQIHPEEKMIKKMLGMGILVPVDSPDLSLAMHCSFMHKSVQEYLASKYIVCSSKYEDTVCIFNSFNNVQDHINMLKFICELVMYEKGNSEHTEASSTGHTSLSAVQSVICMLNTINTELVKDFGEHDWKVIDLSVQGRLNQLCCFLKSLYKTLEEPVWNKEGLTAFILCVSGAYNSELAVTKAELAEMDHSSHLTPVFLDINSTLWEGSFCVMEDRLKYTCPGYGLSVTLDCSRLTVLRLSHIIMDAASLGLMLSSNLSILDLNEVTIEGKTKKAVKPCSSLRYIRLWNVIPVALQTAHILANAIESSTQLEYLWVQDSFLLERRMESYSKWNTVPKCLKHIQFKTTSSCNLTTWALRGPGGHDGKVCNRESADEKWTTVKGHLPYIEKGQDFRSREWIHINTLPLPKIPDRQKLIIPSDVHELISVPYADLNEIQFSEEAMLQAAIQMSLIEQQGCQQSNPHHDQSNGTVNKRKKINQGDTQESNQPGQVQELEIHEDEANSMKTTGNQEEISKVPTPPNEDCMDRLSAKADTSNSPRNSPFHKVFRKLSNLSKKS